MKWLKIKMALIMLALLLVISLATGSEKTEEKPKQVELLFWNFGMYGISYLEQGKEKSEWYISKAIERFEKINPGITIKMDYQDGTKTVEMLTSAAMAQSGPDVVAMWGGVYVTNLKDSLIPLNEYFSPEEMRSIHGWENHAVDNNFYGAPVMKMVACIFYNKSLFREAGVNPSTDYDGTYEEFLNICNKLKNAGITPMINGVGDGWGLSFWEGSLYASQVMDPEELIKDIVDGTKDFSTTPELISAFQTCQDMFKMGYFNDDVNTITRDEAITLFVNSQGAMFSGLSFDLFGMRENLGDDLGVLQMPSMKANSPNFGVCSGGVGPNALVATNYGDHPDVAIKFIKFLRTYKEEKEYVRSTGELPCIDGEYDDVLVDPLQGEFLKYTNIVMMLDNLMPGNVAGTWFSFEPMVVSNQMSVVDFMNEMDSARDEALVAGE